MKASHAQARALRVLMHRAAVESGNVANACGHWTPLGHPIRHRECRDLPLTQCRYGQQR